MLIECKGISVGYGNPEWGAPADKEVFIIKLGNRYITQYQQVMICDMTECVFCRSGKCTGKASAVVEFGMCRTDQIAHLFECDEDDDLDYQYRQL